MNTPVQKVRKTVTLKLPGTDNTGSPGSKTKAKKTSVNPPAALPITINIGLFTKTEGMNAGALTALNNIFLRLESVLSHTPHKFRLLLALPHEKDIDIVNQIFSCSFWEKRVFPEMLFFRQGDSDQVFDDLISGGIRYEIRDVSPERTAYGYDPVSIAVTEYSSLVLIMGNEGYWIDSGEKSPYILAKRYGRTAISIEPEACRTKEIPNDDRIFETFMYFDSYNREKICKNKFSRKREEYIKSLKNDFRVAGLDEEIIEPSYEHLLPHYVRARILGNKYNFLYFMKGILISALSALAVFTIAMQTLFFPDQPALVWLEVIEIGLIIFLMAGSRIGNFHIKRIDYNFLSERIRSAFFIGIICSTCGKKEELPPMTSLRTPNDWMALAFEAIVSSDRPVYCNSEHDFEPLKKFFAAAWINRRLAHYEREAEKARLRYHSLAVSGEIIFTFTLFLAVAHALGVGHWERLFNAELPLIMAFFTITLPAIGAAVSTIRVQGEYHRNLDSYSYIVRHLTSIKTEMKYISGMAELCALLKEVNEMTFGEVHDWKIIFRYTNIENI